MAKDPSKKGIRKIPPTFLDWIESNYGPDVAKWYKTTTGTGKAEATRQRQQMSEMAGSVGGFHEGHFQGAKDIDPVMGGGPTTGRAMRPEIGLTNVAHAELPRMSKSDMKRLGIPQYWVEDFFEAVLESEGQRVIGNLDVQGSLDVDRGMSVEQAAAQTRVRDDLRAQGEAIPGSRYTATDKPAPITQLPAKQPQVPEFDATRIKTCSGIPKVVGTSRVRVPQNPVRFAKGVARFIPGPLDDVILGTGFGGIAAIGALATGRDPAKAFGDVVSDFAVGDLQGGELFREEQDFEEVMAERKKQAEEFPTPMSVLEKTKLSDIDKRIPSLIPVNGSFRLGF